MRGARVMRPGFSAAPGSKRSLTASKARTMRGPNMRSWNSLRTMPSPCSPEWLPLYSATIAKASSAMARRALAPVSCLRFRTGRTCSRPTEACAYQVPSVPCFRNTSVRRSVKSGRSGSATAQSSTKLTGLPASRIDIMMLRPWVRTSQMRAWKAGSTASTTPPAPAWPRSAMTSWSAARRRRFSSASGSANSTSSSAAGSPRTNSSTTGRNCGMSRPRRIIVSSTSSTATGSSVDEVLRRLHRGAEGREVADAERPSSSGRARGGSRRAR